MPDKEAMWKHWVKHFRTSLNGLIKQIEQLPMGERRTKVQECLHAATEHIHGMECDLVTVEDLNLLLYPPLPGATTTHEEEYAVPV